MPLARRAIRPGVILSLVCAAQFMVILDFAVVNVALPSMQADLGVDQSDLQWVVITYGLTFGGFLLLGGRAADLLGRRRVLVAGLTLFTAASLGAGLSGGLGSLVAFRAAQGLGAALAAPAALSILASTFAEGDERNKALGIFGAVGGSAAAFGVILSGALEQRTGLGVDLPDQRADRDRAGQLRPGLRPRQPRRSERGPRTCSVRSR